MSVRPHPFPPAVLVAKLTPPEPRRDMVPRPDLVAALDAAGSRAVRVIVAPAGWGKSELLAQWLVAHSAPVAYVQLDASDADAGRCWAHIVTAVGRAGGVEVDDLLEALRVPGLPLVRGVVEPLLVRLDGHPLTLVLEDLHLADGAELEETLEAWLDGRPAGVGVVVTSRTEPPVQPARRRVRGELVEIRRDDLRTDAETARSIVAEASGHALGDPELAVLLERTEGWAAGLYLAGLSLRSAPDPAASIARFTGHDRNLGEYLASEVFAELDDPTRQFLVGTAVLHELDGAICDAVLERSGSGVVLEQLARTNLFLVPLEQRAGRYRYHHLFRDWLLAELGRRDPAAVGAAHRRAAAAYEGLDDPVRATEHALASGDAELAYRLVVQHQYGLLDTGRHATAIRWHRQLPPPPTPADAVDVDVLRAYAAAIEGDLDTIDRLCARAEAVLASGEIDVRTTERAGDPDLLRAYAAMLRGRFPEARSWLDAGHGKALESRARAARASVAGIVDFWQGRPARSALDTAHELSRRDGVPYAIVLCQAYLALAAAVADDVPAVSQWFDAAQATVAEYPATRNYLAAALVARARAHQVRGRLDEAAGDAELAVELGDRRNDVPVASMARLVLAEIRSTCGDRAGARELVMTVDQDVAPLADAGVLGEALAVQHRQLRLQQRPMRRRAYGRPVEELTERELALLRLLPGDLTQRELGDALHLSFNTVKAYNRQIYRKLGVASRDEAVAAAREHGIL